MAQSIMSIFAFEAGEELVIDRVKGFRAIFIPVVEQAFY